MEQLDQIQKSVDRVLTLEERILDLISDEIPLADKFRPQHTNTWRTPAHILMNSTLDFWLDTVVSPTGVWIMILDPTGTPIWRRHFTFINPPTYAEGGR